MKLFVKWLLLLVIGLFFLAPPMQFLSNFSLSQLHDIIENTNLSKVLLNTIYSSAGGALFSVVLGLFAARIFSQFDWRGKRWFKLALILPYLIPNFILAISYTTSWNPISGLLQNILPLPFYLYSHAGLIFTFGVVHMPLAFLMLEDRITRLDSSLLEAAHLSGASTAQIFKKIEVPLMMPSLLSAFAISFALNLSAFAIPAWIGAPEKIYSLTYKIYQAMRLGGDEATSIAAVYSVLLVVMVIPTMLISYFIIKNEKKYVTLSGKSSRRNLKSFSSFGKVVSLFMFFLLISYFYLAPFLTLFATTLVAPGCFQQSGGSCFSQIGFHSFYYVLFELKETHAAFMGSFLYGTVATVLILLISFCSLLIFSRDKKLLQLSDWFFTLAASLPGTIIAIGLIVMYSGKYSLNLYNTGFMLVFAFMIKYQNLSFQPLRLGFLNLSSHLVEAAQLSGAGTFTIYKRIIIPILKPEIISSTFLVLIPILGELTMSIFLVTPSIKTIGSLMFDLQDYADQSSASTLAIILVTVTVILNEFAYRLSNGKVGY